jgi:hypothetical protein
LQTFQAYPEFEIGKIKMNNLIAKSLADFQLDLQINYEVNHLLRDMVESVSLCHLQNDYFRLQENHQVTESFNQTLIDRVKWIEKEYDSTKRELTFVKLEAKTVREKFVNQIGSFLSDNRLNQKLKTQILELEDRLSRYKPEDEREEEEKENNEDEVKEGKGKEETAEKTTTETTAPKETQIAVKKYVKDPKKLVILDETALLHLFSFLQTMEVLNYAQVCRFVYQRIDRIFGIDSATVKPEWSLYPVPPRPPPAIAVVPANEVPAPSPKPTPVDHSNSSLNSLTFPSSSSTPASLAKNTTTSKPAEDPTEMKLTREMIEEFTKRLTPQQMKFIVSLVEKSKKQTSMVDMLAVEKEDLSARLQNTESIRDFMIDKLKTAELAIKSMMHETNTYKKQSASDSEIISYLDLQVQDLDGQLLEANHRCSHLQASLELQVNSLSVKVSKRYFFFHSF